MHAFGCMQTMEEMENEPECPNSPEKFRIKQISSTLIFASAVKYISHWQVTCHYFLTPVLFHSQIHGMLLELFYSRKIIDQIINLKTTIEMFISKTGFWQRQQWFLALFYRYSNVGIF